MSATAARPRFSVVTPVCDPTPMQLDELWASLRAQRTESWEWCIADDASSNAEVVRRLDAIAADPRVRFVRNDERQGIVASTNRAAALARADYLAFVDHDDLLHAAALSDVSAAIDAHGSVSGPPVVLYTDEDVLDDAGDRVAPFAKPAWSPERLRSQNYVGHLTVVMRSEFEAVGGLRAGFDGSQDLDLLLRLGERTDRFVKVPGVRYHWRASPTSVAGSPTAKPYAYEAAQRAIAEHCDRLGIAAEVVHLEPKGRYAVLRRPAHPVSTALVVTGAADHGRFPHERSSDALRRLADEVGATFVDLDAALGTARSGVAVARNLAAASCTAEVVVFVERSGRIQTDVATWQHLAALAVEDGVGLVGLANRLADGSVLDAGVVMGPDGPVALLADVPVDADHNRGELAVTRETGAVTGWSLVVSRAVLDEVGGLSPAMGFHESVIDLCLKTRLTGRRVLWTPTVSVVFPVAHRWVDPPVAHWGAEFEERWRPWLGTDPYYTSDVRLGRAHHVPGVGYPD